MSRRINDVLIRNEYPEIEWIQDEHMKNACIQAFIDAYSSGGWRDEYVKDVPVSVAKIKNKERNKLTRHVRTVVKIAVSIYDSLNESYELKHCSRDAVIAGALLHDIGKMTEFQMEDNGTFSYSPTAKILRHPLAGVLIAGRNGLDADVIHIISTHSFEGNSSYKTLEAKIVCAADNIAFECLLDLDTEVF